MNPTVRWSSSLLALLALAPGAVRAQDTAERAAVQRVIVALANNIHTGRLTENEALFTPTGVHILTGGLALHAWGEFVDQHLRGELARFPDARYAHTGVETSVRGAIAWAAFRWQMSSAGDGPAPVLGRGSAVLEKLGDEWRIAHLHFSR